MSDLNNKLKELRLVSDDWEKNSIVNQGNAFAALAGLRILLDEIERLRWNEETMQVNADYCAEEIPKLRKELEDTRAENERLNNQRTQAHKAAADVNIMCAAALKERDEARAEAKRLRVALEKMVGMWGPGGKIAHEWWTKEIVDSARTALGAPDESKNKK